MVGIVDYTTYVPSYRLQRELIAEQWGTKSIGGVKAVSNFDEDALTMGFAAAWNLLDRAAKRNSIDALYFASTTAPHWERASSSFIGAACDLPDEIDTIDFGGTLRSGTAALRAALNAVASGANKRIIVTVADVREGAPGSLQEQQFGDGAAAVMVGRDGVVAEYIAHESRYDDFFDEWRRDRDRYVSVLSSRYSTERGYIANSVAVGQRVLEKVGIGPGDISLVALSSPDGKAHLTVAKKLGFAPEQLVQLPTEEGGLTGSPMPLALLCKSFDVLEPGAMVLTISYGDGADALLFRVTAATHKKTVSSAAELNLQLPSYTIYRKLRDFSRKGPEEGAVISNVMFEKEERQNVRLHATRCPRCETVQFPLTIVCVKCHNRDALEEVQMARSGTIVTFTSDYLYNAPNKPTVMTVIELADGARFYCQETDVDAEKVHIGQRVQLTLRRLTEGGGMHHYYWKCRPA